MKNVEKWESTNGYDPELHREEPDPISVTMPNMSMTPKEILARFTVGQSLQELKGTYEFTEYDENGQPIIGDQPLPDFSRMDRVERIEAFRAIANEMEDLNSKILQEQSRVNELKRGEEERAKAKAAAAAKYKKDEPKEVENPTEGSN